jgi:hypothetical protein
MYILKIFRIYQNKNDFIHFIFNIYRVHVYTVYNIQLYIIIWLT